MRNQHTLFSFRLMEAREIKNKRLAAIIGLIFLIISTIIIILWLKGNNQLNLYNISIVFLILFFVGYMLIKQIFPKFNEKIFFWILRILTPLFSVVFLIYFIKFVLNFDSVLIEKSIISTIYFAGLSAFFAYIAFKFWKGWLVNKI